MSNRSRRAPIDPAILEVDPFPGEARPRLLLIELLSTDRFSQYRGEYFPFFCALAESLDVPCRHLVLGFDPEEQANRFVLTLPDLDIERVAKIITEYKASHVFFNERLTKAMEEIVVRSSPFLVIRYMDYSELRPFGPSPRTFVSWLGLPEAAADRIWGRDKRHLVDLVAPLYRKEPINKLSAEIVPLIKVICGPSCLYSRPLARSVHFSEEDLEGAKRSFGCSFCTGSGDLKSPFTRSPVDLAIEQILALESTDPFFRPPREFNIEGAGVFSNIERFFAQILENELPPSQFFFSCRVDEMLRKAAAIEEALPDLFTAGHKVHFWNMGVENFSVTENERLNKNISFHQVEEVLDLMVGWEKRWPDSFFFLRHGGFGFILFTPWTTLEDLHQNAVGLRKLDAMDRGFCLSTRLLLLPDLPITNLARRDGLVASTFSDPLMGRFCPAGCISEWDQREIPWRFADPHAELIHRIMLRRVVRVMDECPDDPELDLIRSTLESLPSSYSSSNLDLFELLIDLLRRYPEAATVADIMERLSASYPKIRDGGPASHESESPDLEAIRRRTERAIKLLVDHPGRPLRGFAADEPRIRGDRVMVTLARGAESLALFIVSGDKTERAYRRTSDLAIIHDQATPVDTGPKKQVIDILARALDLA